MFNRFILRAWGSALNWPVFFADAYHQTLAATADLEIQDDTAGHRVHQWRILGPARNSANRTKTRGTIRNAPASTATIPATVLVGDNGVEEGDSVHWDATMAYVNANPLANDAAYDYVTTRVDVANFARYMIHCVYTGKRDWPEQNEVKWRPRTADGKWRWAQRDMDHGLSS